MKQQLVIAGQLHGERLDFFVDQLFLYWGDSGDVFLQATVAKLWLEQVWSSRLRAQPTSFCHSVDQAVLLRRQGNQTMFLQPSNFNGTQSSDKFSSRSPMPLCSLRTSARGTLATHG